MRVTTVSEDYLHTRPPFHRYPISKRPQDAALAVRHRSMPGGGNPGYCRGHKEIEELKVLCPGVNRRTLQRDLRDLVQQGVVKSIVAARTVRYVLQIKGL